MPYDGDDSWEFLGQQGDQTSQFKGNQPWMFTERTDAEAEAPTLWPPDAKSWLIKMDKQGPTVWHREPYSISYDKP